MLSLAVTDRNRTGSSAHINGANFFPKRATLVLIAFRHGLRASEVCDLELSQVELWARVRGRAFASRRPQRPSLAALISFSTSLGVRYSRCLSSELGGRIFFLFHEGVAAGSMKAWPLGRCNAMDKWVRPASQMRSRVSVDDA